MPADFPIPLMCYDIPKDEPERPIVINDNKPNMVILPDGRKLHILLENPAIAKKPLTEDQKRDRTVLGLAALFLLLTICMVCFLLDSL